MNLNIPFVNGVYKRKHDNPYDRYHDVALDVTDVTSGTLTIRARKNGSSFFEDLPDGVIDLALPTSITFQGTVIEYEFTLADAVGTTNTLEITDTSSGGR